MKSEIKKKENKKNIVGKYTPKTNYRHRFIAFDVLFVDIGMKFLVRDIQAKL